MITHRRQLVDLMKALGLPLIAAEVGVAEGLFSNDLLSEGLERLYSIDNWGKIDGQRGDGGFEQQWHDQNFKEVKDRLSKYGNKSITVRQMSVMAAKLIPDGLGLVYIDCDHSYAGVWNDIQAYWPKLVSGGVMAFHDYENPSYGVKDAVQEFAKGNNLEIHLLPEDKPVDAGAYIIKP